MIGSPAAQQSGSNESLRKEPAITVSDDLCLMSATELAAAFATKALSPVEVTRAVLGRITRLNPDLNAYCTIACDSAIMDSARAEAAIMRGDDVPVLSGIPVAFKDATETAGIRTTYGSQIFSEYVPNEDAIVVERTRKAGAVIIGKTNTPEFACKGTTDNSVFGPTRNPWDLERTAGGSSGGSAAAIAAGLATLAEGSDLAGSVRIPASLCGVVGFRPSLGRVPTYPTPNAWTTILTHGPLARTVADAALFYSVLAGPDVRDPQSVPEAQAVELKCFCLSGLRVAWSPTLGYAPVDPIVRSVVEAAVLSLSNEGLRVEAADPGFADPRELFIALSAPWRAGVCGAYIPQWKDKMDPALVERIGRTGSMTAIAYEHAQQKRSDLSRTVAAFFQDFDILLTPTTSVAAFPIDLDFPSIIDGHSISSQLDWYPHTFPFSMTGQPAISIPAGWTDEGLPVGLQIVGRRFDDAKVLQVAAVFEAIRPWRQRYASLTKSRAHHAGYGP